MEYLLFTNSKGETYTFGQDASLVSVEGLGDVTADVQTQKTPFRDGSTYLDAVFEDRLITMEFIIKGQYYEEISGKRQRLGRIISPKLGTGVLTYRSGRIIKEIDAVATSAPVFPDGSDNRSERFQRGMVSFLCPSPFWRTPQITEEPAFEPLFQFPFEGPFQMGMQRDQRVIINDGDSPAPLYVEFYGPATNPIIRNLTTGEYIKVNRTLAEGEYMRIDTTPGKKKVEFVAPNGTVTNVFNWIDLGSTFFNLIVGENQIEYSADSNVQGAIVNIQYSKLFNTV